MKKVQKSPRLTALYIVYLGILLSVAYSLHSTLSGFLVIILSGTLVGTGIFMVLRECSNKKEPQQSESSATLSNLDQRFHMWLENNSRELQPLPPEDIITDRYLNEYFVVFQADIETPLPDEMSEEYAGLLALVKLRLTEHLPLLHASVSVSAVQKSIIGCVNYAEHVAEAAAERNALIEMFDEAQQDLLLYDQIDLTFSVSDVDLKQDEIAQGFRQLEDLHWYMDIFSYDPTGETINLDLIQGYVLKTEDRAVQFQSRNLLQLEKHFITCVLDQNFASAKRLMNDIITKNLVENISSPIDCYHTAFEKVKGLMYDAIEATRLQVDAEFFGRLFPKYGITDVTTVPELQTRCSYIFDQLITYEEQRRASAPPELYEKIRTYVEHNITDPGLNITTIAMALNQNPATISRIFREHSGSNLLDFIHRSRVDIAKCKLEQGMTVVRVAEETGFGSTRTFTRAFQKLEGISPSNYQEIHK